MLLFIFLILALCSALLLAAFTLIGVLGAVGVFLAVFFGLNFVYLIFLYLVSLCYTDRSPITRQDLFCCFLMRLTVGWLFAWFRIKVHSKGLEKLPKTPFILVSNHLSRFDPMVQYYAIRDRKMAFLSKPENLKIQIVGNITHRIGFLPVDRENALRALRAVHKTADNVKTLGISYGIYPEGTRSKNGDLLPFKPGAFVAAKRAGVPVVVSVLRGTAGVSGRLFSPVDFEILDLIDAQEVQNLKPEELAERAWDLIAENI